MASAFRATFLAGTKVGLLLCLVTGPGCDIVQGFRNAGDAIFPPEQTYLDVPGFVLVKGPYRGLEFAAGSDLFLLARTSDPNDDALYGMRYADPKPCTLANVGRHQAGHGTFAGPAMIGYFEANAGCSDPSNCPEAQVLHFADATCKNYALTLPGAALPMDERPSGFAVLSAGDWVLVDPVAGISHMLTPAVQDIRGGVLPGVNIVLSGGRLDAFSSDWTEIGWFGNSVVAYVNSGPGFFFEDASGIHRLSPSGATLSDTIIDPSGCHLAAPSSPGATESWVTYDSPCADPKLVAYGVSSTKTSDLGLPLSPDNLVLAPAWPNMGGDPATDPFFFLYLNDRDASYLGTLILRTPDDVEHPLGTNAALDGVTVISNSTGTWGYALIGVQPYPANPSIGMGTLIRFSGDGSTEEVAHQVVRGPSDLIVNFDGHSADFALPSDTGVSVVAQHVPPGTYRYREAKGRWSAVLSDYDGSGATLSVTTSDLSFFNSALTMGPAPSFDVLARGVFPRGTAFLTSLPGISYVTNFDRASATGRLQYRNLELGFTATVSDGMSDYISTDDGIIYSVPFGERAGIWLVRAR
jgi:hypothetical protein